MSLAISTPSKIRIARQIASYASAAGLRLAPGAVLLLSSLTLALPLSGWTIAAEAKPQTAAGASLARSEMPLPDRSADETADRSSTHRDEAVANTPREAAAPVTRPRHAAAVDGTPDKAAAVANTPREAAALVTRPRQAAAEGTPQKAFAVANTPREAAALVTQPRQAAGAEGTPDKAATSGSRRKAPAASKTRRKAAAAGTQRKAAAEASTPRKAAAEAGTPRKAAASEAGTPHKAAAEAGTSRKAAAAAGTSPGAATAKHKERKRTAKRRGSYSLSRSCLPKSIKVKLAHIEEKWGPVRVVSTFRKGAVVAGSGGTSMHAHCRAVDFHPSPGTYKQVLNYLKKTHKGGLGTYACGMHHLHIDNGADRRWHHCVNKRGRPVRHAKKK